MRGRGIVVQWRRERFFRALIIDGIPRRLRLRWEILGRALLGGKERALILLRRIDRPLSMILIYRTGLRRARGRLFVLEKNGFRDAGNGGEQLFDDTRIGDPKPVRKDFVRGGNDKSVVAQLEARVGAEPCVVTLVANARA